MSETNDEKLDKFYTVPRVVNMCLSIIEKSKWSAWDKWDLVIEPSAGNGAFLLKIPTNKKIGIDIAPEHIDIIKGDFLKYMPDTTLTTTQRLSTGQILVIGNPPFGRVSSLAIKFFNHAAKFASVIAFIVPRTFRRISVQNKLNLNFHIILDEEIPTSPCAFNPPMMAKCCFQIWEKRNDSRAFVDLPTSHDDWEFLSNGPADNNGQPTPPANADFAIRAYGGKCGEIMAENLNILRPKSWHWIKSNIDKEELKKRFKSLNYDISMDTARQNSIGRGELVKIYTEMYN